MVFAVASLAQLVTGHMLDRWGARPTLALVTLIQIAAFLMMPGLDGLAARGGAWYYARRVWSGAGY